MIEKVEYKGDWRLPDSDTWMKGIVTYSPEDGIILELFGTFKKHIFDHSNYDIVLGKTTEGDITLVDNWYRSTKTNLNGTTIGVYNPRIILVGKHFDTISEITFREISFQLFNLFDWSDISGITSDYDEISKRYSIGYQKPSELEFSIYKDCQGLITFFSPLHRNSHNNRIELHEECEVSLKYKDKVHFEELLTDMSIFQRFITLTTFEQSYPLSITFNDDDYFKEVRKTKQKIQIKCIFPNIFYNKKYQVRRSSESLLRFKDIREEFPKLISNWFEKYKELEPSFVLLLDYFIDKNKFNTEKFMDIIRGLETFHRRTSSVTRLPKTEFKKKIKKILNTIGLEEQDKKWLKEELSYSNELKLRERLSLLITTHSNKYIQKQIVNIDSFCKDVVNTRNYHTHYSKKPKTKILIDKEFFDVTQILTGLLISCLLNYIGVNDSVFEERLDNLLY
jgi:hypothetical protein